MPAVHPEDPLVEAAYHSFNIQNIHREEPHVAAVYNTRHRQQNVHQEVWVLSPIRQLGSKRKSLLAQLHERYYRHIQGEEFNNIKFRISQKIGNFQKGIDGNDLKALHSAKSFDKASFHPTTTYILHFVR